MGGKGGADLSSPCPLLGLPRGSSSPPFTVGWHPGRPGSLGLGELAVAPDSGFWQSTSTTCSFVLFCLCLSSVALAGPSPRASALLFCDMSVGQLRAASAVLTTVCPACSNLTVCLTASPTPGLPGAPVLTGVWLHPH